MLRNPPSRWSDRSNVYIVKKDIKQHVRFHPDTFFQLAYFKLHGFKPTPTYETAST